MFGAIGRLDRREIRTIDQARKDAEPMSDDSVLDDEPSQKAVTWTAPKLIIIDLSEMTEFFNGGAGDSNTGS